MSFAHVFPNRLRALTAMRLSQLDRRRLALFKANRRGYWSLWIFAVLFFVTLFAEFVSNDRPLLVSYKGHLYAPVFVDYPETTFGGEFPTTADYTDPFVKDLIAKNGWALWPLNPYRYDTIVKDIQGGAPSAPTLKNWLGTDGTARDVVARLIYGFRISVLFGLTLTIVSSIIGVAAGAIQGYFGGLTDLLFQRFIEIWTSLPRLYVIIIVASFIKPNFWILLGIMLAYSWVSLVAVVRAEFLRARNFEFVTAARALGVRDAAIIWRHLLPNAMVATLTYMPFVLNEAITTLTALDFLGYGMPIGSPSLGELLNQGKANLHAPWLGLTAFAVIAIMLSLLIFIGEAVRDAYDPRKTIG